MCLSKCIKLSRFLSKQYSYTHVINSVCPKCDLENLGSNEIILELKWIKIWIYIIHMDRALMFNIFSLTMGLKKLLCSLNSSSNKKQNTASQKTKQQLL